jgi:hypothetical protein
MVFWPELVSTALLKGGSKGADCIKEGQPRCVKLGAGKLTP